MKEIREKIKNWTERRQRNLEITFALKKVIYALPKPVWAVIFFILIFQGMVGLIIGVSGILIYFAINQILDCLTEKRVREITYLYRDLKRYILYHPMYIEDSETFQDFHQEAIRAFKAGIEVKNKKSQLMIRKFMFIPFQDCIRKVRDEQKQW